MHLIDTYIGDWCKHPHNDGQKVFVFGDTNEMICPLAKTQAIGIKPCDGCAHKTVEEHKEHPRKPPLGVVPEAIVREKRMAELARAIREYVEGGDATSKAALIYKWADELLRLSRRLGEVQSPYIRKPTP